MIERMLQRVGRLFGRGREELSLDGGTRAERGRFGEDLAVAHCQQVLGYRVIARNWRCHRDEVDIICADGAVLIFIEVRARAEGALISGYHTVTKKKKDTLRRAYKNYLKQLDKPPKHFRFDIIEVSISKLREGRVRHYANVPLFHKHYMTRQD